MTRATREIDLQRRSSKRRRPKKSTVRSRKNSKRKLRLWAKLLVAMFILCVACGLGLLGYTAYVLTDLPDWDEQHLANDSTTFLYNNENTVYAELHGSENRTPISIEDMPQYLIDCFIGSEDTRFEKHHGIDVKRIIGAAIADIKAGSAAQGASTITMQLARNAILEDQDKKLARKIKEAAIAIQLERQYTKDEILEMYLNEIYFGHGAYGVQAAAHTYFNKDVTDLTLSECAVLTGVIKNPKLFSPINNLENATDKRNVVLESLRSYRPEYAAEIDAAKAEAITVNEGAATGDDYKYPWYTDYVISEAEDILETLGIDSSNVYTGGYRIYTAVNEDVQELMEEAYADADNFPSSASADRVESAMVVLSADNSSILGLVGGREYTAKRGFSRATDMTRQPGSTFKPIGVFAPAIEAGYSPATVANDVKTTFGVDYTPGNTDGSYSGVVTMREAARRSINIPAVKYLQMIGVPTSMEMCEKLGIMLDKEKDAGLSTALGGLTYGVSPLQMAAAYAAFANGGVYTAPHAILKIEDSQGTVLYESDPARTTAMKETTAYQVTSMLQTVTESGTGTTARLSNRSVASKTGTVQLPDTGVFKGVRGNKDAWFAAYTPEMVGVVWMGYDSDVDSNGDPQYLRQVYGGRYPAQLWKEVIGGASENLPASTFTRPSDVVSVAIDTKSGLLPSSDTPAEFVKSEIFARDHVPTKTSDIWHKVTVCTETNLIATEFCPETEDTVRFSIPVESNTISGLGADDEWVYHTTTCTTHTKAGENSVQVTICTDPSHNGELVLANVARNGQTGGCPSQYVTTRYVSRANAPTKYCGISGHKVSAPAASSGGSTANSLKTPGQLTAKAAATSATVSWTDSNADVVYQLEYWEDGGSHQQVNTYNKEATISNLDSGKTYNLRVRAISEADSSRTSSWSSTVTVSIP